MAVSSLSYARVGPVHFQPIDWELEPLRGYCTGNMLNAGCGDRDITQLLAEMGAQKVVNLDLTTNIPGAVKGALDNMPFDDAMFDAILCNAVLEHVEWIDRVMAEMKRVLKPGGHLLVAIPFLQPYHESPSDFRRFSHQGMRELGESAGLEVISVTPVHSIAQTLGWIAWEYVSERGSLILKALLWPMIWLATRYSCRTNTQLVRSANTFQAVYRKSITTSVPATPRGRR